MGWPKGLSRNCIHSSGHTEVRIPKDRIPKDLVRSSASFRSMVGQVTPNRTASSAAETPSARPAAKRFNFRSSQIWRSCLGPMRGYYKIAWRRPRRGDYRGAGDGRLLRTGAANFSASGLTRQDNDLVVIESPEASRVFTRAFKARYASGELLSTGAKKWASPFVLLIESLTQLRRNFY